MIPVIGHPHAPEGEFLECVHRKPHGLRDSAELRALEGRPVWDEGEVIVTPARLEMSPGDALSAAPQRRALSQVVEPLREADRFGGCATCRYCLLSVAPGHLRVCGPFLVVSSI